jgi:hypothetical protein
MGWLDRVAGDGPSAEEASRTPDGADRGSGEERTSLGLKALFDGVADDDSHSVLDLGRGAASSFVVYGRYARRIRFADLLRPERRPDLDAAMAASVPPQPDHPYDLILAWDLLDRIADSQREAVVRRLAELAAPGARIHVLVDASDQPEVRQFRFAVLEEDKLRYEPAGPDRPAGDRLLPAEVERLLDPWEVVRAFTSRSGMREYVGILRG